MITYQIEEIITVDEFAQILVDSTLAERRPINEHQRLGEMLKNANLIVTARDNARLVGIARSLTDFAYCTYLSDLAVDENYQNRGIGRELIRITKRYSLKAKLILISAPGAVDYYPKIGMKQNERCYVFDDIDDLV